MRVILLIILYGIVFQASYAQLRVKEGPEAGKPVSIQYDNLQARLKVFFYDRDKKTGEAGGASVMVPEHTVLLHVIAILPGGEVDNNNGNGYMFPVLKDGQPAPFAYYRMSELASGIPLDSGRLSANRPRQLEYLRKEFALYPSAEAMFRQAYFNLLANSPEPADKAELVKKLLAYQTRDERELTMSQRYLSFLGQQRAADSIAGILRADFPKGLFVKEERMKAIRQEKDPAGKEHLYQAFISEFSPDKADEFLFEEMYRDMAMSALQNNNTAAAGKYVKLIRDPRRRIMAYAKVALAARSLPMARSGVMATDTTQRSVSWDAYLALGSLLYEQQRYTSAMQYAAPAYVHTKSREAAMLYAQLLNATGRLPEARLILEKAVSAGQASVGMKALLQEIYTRTGETRTIAISTDSNLVKKVRAEMVHEPVSTITLKDISGKPVSLSALKGKIVVLDFWATWCKPCIASFPAMQQVMRQHPDVVFLFIATFEKGNALQNVQRFAKENAYLFRYVMDEPLTGDIFKGYTHFKVTGVPYKLVIDKEGFIRFRSGGFAGNDDVLINELNAVIAALR